MSSGRDRLFGDYRTVHADITKSIRLRDRNCRADNAVLRLGQFNNFGIPECLQQKRAAGRAIG